MEWDVVSRPGTDLSRTLAGLIPPVLGSQSRAVAEFAQGGAVDGNVVLCLRDGQDDHHGPHSDALETARGGYTAGFA